MCEKACSVAHYYNIKSICECTALMKQIITCLWENQHDLQSTCLWEQYNMKNTCLWVHQVNRLCLEEQYNVYYQKYLKHQKYNVPVCENTNITASQTPVCEGKSMQEAVSSQV